MMVLEGTMFSLGMALVPQETVVAAFVRFCGGTPAMAGLCVTMMNLPFYLGEFVCGLFVHRLRNQMRFMQVTAVFSRGFLILFAAVMLLPGLMGTKAAVWLFLLAFLLIFILDGFVALIWNQILVRTVPEDRRSAVFAVMQSTCGGLGLLTGFVIQRILLSSMSEAWQFRVIFLLAGFVFFGSAVSMQFFRDLPHPCDPDRPVRDPVTYLKALLPMLKKKPLRDAVIGRVLFMMTTISASVNYTLGVQSGLSEKELTYLVYMPVLGQIVSGLFWTRVVARRGDRGMMLFGQVLGSVFALWGLVVLWIRRNGHGIMIPLCILMAGLKFTYVANNGFAQHALSMASEEERADTVVLFSLITAPVSFGTALAGAISTYAFWPVYALMLLCGLSGILQTARSLHTERRA